MGAWTLDRVIGAFERVAVSADEVAWLAAFRACYLDLSTSEHAWSHRHL